MEIELTDCLSFRSKHHSSLLLVVCLSTPPTPFQIHCCLSHLIPLSCSTQRNLHYNGIKRESFFHEKLKGRNGKTFLKSALEFLPFAQTHKHTHPYIKENFFTYINLIIKPFFLILHLPYFFCRTKIILLDVVLHCVHGPFLSLKFN